MKTLRLIGTTLLMVLCAVNFTACSDDEEQQGDKTLSLLIGSWEMTETWETTQAQYDPVTGKYETVTVTETYNILIKHILVTEMESTKKQKQVLITIIKILRN